MTQRTPRTSAVWRLLAILALLSLVGACSGDGGSATDAADEPNDAGDEDTAIEDDGDAASGETVTLRIGYILAADSLGGDLIGAFVDYVESESDGQIAVQRFDDAALGGESDLMGQIADGSLDMGLIGSGVVSSLAPKSNVTELPFMWESQEQLIDVVFDGPIGDEIGEQLAEEGVTLLGWGEWGPRDIFGNGEPVLSMSDLDGLQIRVVENPLYLATLRSWGAVPTAIPFPEVYSALQQGVVTAVDTNPGGFVDASLYEVTEWVAKTAHIHTALALLITSERFDSLDEDLQQIVLDGAEQAQTEHRQRAATERDAMFERMEAEGMEVVEPDTSEMEAAAVEIQNTFAEEAGWTDTLERARELQ